MCLGILYEGKGFPHIDFVAGLSWLHGAAWFESDS